MWPDVVDMKEFYTTALGQVARRMIRGGIRALLPNLKGQNFVGLGYVTPFIRYYREEAKRLVVVMPAEQGALSWSKKTPNVVTLADEYQLPLADKSVDVLLICHTLEFTPHTHEVLREAWRVLSDSGKLLVVVPSRGGIWARVEGTPFGHGEPYSQNQVKKLLRENLFTPERVEHALYVPPIQSRIFLSTARIWEKIGRRWFKNMSGVVLIEATKDVYGVIPMAEPTWLKKWGVVGQVALQKKLMRKE